MSSEYEEVRILLRALCGKVIECKEPLNAQAIGDALFGIMCIDSSCMDIWNEIFFSSAVSSLFKSVEVLQLVDSRETMLMLIQRLALVSHFMKYRSSDTLKHLNRIKEFYKVDEGCRRPIVKPSRAEVKYSKSIRKILKDHGKDYDVQVNEFLHEDFEADVVIRAGSKYYNIEIDGPSHRNPVKKRFAAFRDKYLEEKHGISIGRIDVMREGKNMSSDQLVEECLKKLRLVG